MMVCVVRARGVVLVGEFLRLTTCHSSCGTPSSVHPSFSVAARSGVSDPALAEGAAPREEGEAGLRRQEGVQEKHK